jgi:hypothetical protein
VIAGVSGVRVVCGEARPRVARRGPGVDGSQEFLNEQAYINRTGEYTGVASVVVLRAPGLLSMTA